jgi:hypothetical protein
MAVYTSPDTSVVGVEALDVRRVDRSAMAWCVVKSLNKIAAM